MSPRLAVIIGSTRPGRIGPKVAEWFAAIARTDGRFEVDVVDLADFGFPMEMGLGAPRMGHYHPNAMAFAERVGKADAFAFVTPEYNHGYPASLKSALDAIYKEWTLKPATFVSYGGASGGLRAIEQLRQVAAELHIHDIQASVSIPFVFGAFNEDGSLKDAVDTKSAQAVFDQLAWWSNALKVGRKTSPFKP